MTLLEKLTILKKTAKSYKQQENTLLITAARVPSANTLGATCQYKFAGWLSFCFFLPKKQPTFNAIDTQVDCFYGFFPC